MSKNSNLEKCLSTVEGPVLIISTIVGKGIYTMGEALEERLKGTQEVHHMAIEDLLPSNAVNEDLKRYNFISNRLPFLLYLIYTFPLIYKRKLVRERLLKTTNLDGIKKKIEELGIKTVICASHRPAFWLSLLKEREGMDFSIWGFLSEYGRNLGWKYIPWNMVDKYLSPVSRECFDYPFPQKLDFVHIDLPAKEEYYPLRKVQADKNRLLFVAGNWGQVAKQKVTKLLDGLQEEHPKLQISVVCGKNEKLYSYLSNYYHNNDRFAVQGELPTLKPLIEQCASVITKPGISTTVECHTAKRQIFYIKGMPVAEDNNVRHAIENFGALWFSHSNFKAWYKSNEDRPH